MDIVTKAQESIADFSDCMKYRWSLKRDLRNINSGDKVINFIMLNPSTANEEFNDPTVARCENRAIDMGYSYMIVTNIFAFRATEPSDMRGNENPIGDLNDKAILESALEADYIICAWGNHGEFLERGASVKKILDDLNKPLYYLKMNSSGEPSHPLYLKKDITPILWNKTKDKK